MPSTHLLRSAFAFAFALSGCGGSERPAAAPKAQHSSERAETARVLPELEAMTVARSLRGNELELRECFERDGVRIPGFMQLSFHVDAEGKVTNVEVETSSFAEPNVASCLSEQVERLHFDPPGEAKLARWTFVAGLPRESEGSPVESGAKKRTSKAQEQGVVIDDASRGSLEPDEIEDIVHAGFGLFGHCYREGLGRHPGLSGSVNLRMVIGRDGVVDSLKDNGSRIADRELVDCVAEGFFALRFPKPRAKTVRLQYRIVFDAY